MRDATAAPWLQVLPLDKYVFNTEAHPLPILPVPEGIIMRHDPPLPAPSDDLAWQLPSTGALTSLLRFYAHYLPRNGSAALAPS